MATNLNGRTIFGKQLMATVSVMIVLLILGLFAAAAVGASRFADSLKSRMGFTVVMSDDVSDEDLNNVQALLSAAPYTGTITFTSADETLAQWEKDNGENILEILGVNPFGAQYEVTVTTPYATSDSLLSITQHIEHLNGVDEVSTTTQVVDIINKFVNILSMIFIPLAVALLIVSSVLINNTVRLTVYSSRFLIHTMKLVGATGSFIRHPFIKTGIINGIVAGVIAGCLLALIISIVHSGIADLETYVSWGAVAWIFPAMVVVGIIICGTAAALATNKYLKLDYDKMF